MSHNLGLKALVRLCEQQDTVGWYRAKLSTQLFTASEAPVYEWVDQHVKQHHALPQVVTLAAKFPDTAGIPAPEPASYYVELLETQFGHKTINGALQEVNELLKQNPHEIRKAQGILRAADSKILQQQYRSKILDFGTEAPQMLLQEYHSPVSTENMSIFGWPYLDDMGGAMPGDVVSYVGRPASGKTFCNLRTAIKNWQLGKNVLFVSMEMGSLPLAQRIAAMIAGTNLTQLKAKTYATPTYTKFMSTLMGISNSGVGKLYIVNGNLAADPEDVYTLARQLGCLTVIIDGAYLMRNKNPRLDRYTRVAENCELIKRYTEDEMLATFCSWQFNRDASKKKKAGVPGEAPGLEDIGYSDAIGQISSVAVGMFQEEGVETMLKRVLRLLKGRSGEIGQFEIYWDFNAMNFDQVSEEQTAASDTPLAEEFI